MCVTTYQQSIQLLKLLKFLQRIILVSKFGATHYIAKIMFFDLPFISDNSV